MNNRVADGRNLPTSPHHTIPQPIPRTAWCYSSPLTLFPSPFVQTFPGYVCSAHDQTSNSAAVHLAQPVRTSGAQETRLHQGSARRWVSRTCHVTYLPCHVGEWWCNTLSRIMPGALFYDSSCAKHSRTLCPVYLSFWIASLNVTYPQVSMSFNAMYCHVFSSLIVNCHMSMFLYITYFVTLINITYFVTLISITYFVTFINITYFVTLINITYFVTLINRIPQDPPRASPHGTARQVLGDHRIFHRRFPSVLGQTDLYWVLQRRQVQGLPQLTTVEQNDRVGLGREARGPHSFAVPRDLKESWKTGRNSLRLGVRGATWRVRTRRA